jgi:CRISPR system Cascade subunit CasB
VNERRWDQNLVEHLTELNRADNPDRATLAHLRRGLQAPPDYTLARVGWLFRRVPERDLEDAILAAGLFAWVKGACAHTEDNVSFGAAFGAELTADEKQQREKRFIDLLDTDKDELPYKLRQAITLISREGTELNWALLITHLRHWAHEDRWVQKQWARDYWGAAPKEQSDAVTPAVSE